MLVRLYRSTDHDEWRRMRTALWPGQTLDDMAEWLEREDAAVLVAARGDRGLSGFAEVGQRSHADACLTSPVAYLEGWYVDPDMRRRGIGAALIAAVRAWSLARGYRELASDAELANVPAHRSHEGVGFTEVGRAVVYLMTL